MPLTPLTPELLIHAYCQGLFPMARSRRSRIVEWYRPELRAILPLTPGHEFHISRSLQRRLRSGRFRLTRDRAFGHVIRACSLPRRTQHQTWINATIIDAYTHMHELGLAHSVEAWLPVDTSAPTGGVAAGEGVPAEATALLPHDADPDAPPTPCRLAGGLYGIALGGVFFGESMFSHAADASKVCLVHLVEHLRQRGFVLLDSQVGNPHMAQFGILEVPNDEYMTMLHEALELPVDW